MLTHMGADVLGQPDQWGQREAQTHLKVCIAFPCALYSHLKGFQRNCCVW